jgi:arsenite-transporting ATPase
MPMLKAPLFTEEVVGMAALESLATAVYGEGRPEAVLRDSDPLRFERTASGYLLIASLPFVERDEVDVFRAGDELHLKVGSHHRSIMLPAALARCVVAGAAMTDGELRVRFTSPDGREQPGE